MTSMPHTKNQCFGSGFRGILDPDPESYKNGKSAEFLLFCTYKIKQKGF